jgi:tetratricopeptide (TPR) repeat protein
VARARQAITTTDYLEAIRILNDEVETNPSPDAYLYLGLSHANLDQHERALEVFEEGRALYPADSRFLAETAGVHLARRNTQLAREALEQAREINPADVYATDLLASLRMSEGEVREALDVWNGVGQPRIESTFQNFSPGFLDRIAPRAVTFGPGDLLTYGGWKTTEQRMFATHL